MSMYVVYTGIDNIQRAREVNSYHEAGQVLVSLKDRNIKGELKKASELVNEAATCLPLFAQRHEALV
jgi:hypothetical protein